MVNHDHEGVMSMGEGQVGDKIDRECLKGREEEDLMGESGGVTG